MAVCQSVRSISDNLFVIYVFCYWSKQQWQTFTFRVPSVTPDCITLWVLADPLSWSWIWASLSLQHRTVSAHFLPLTTTKCSSYNSQTPIWMEEWKISKVGANVDCVVWLKTACWSSLPWCFEDRWRLGSLKTAAGNYLVPLSLLIFSAVIYNLTAVYNSLGIGHVSFRMDRELSCSSFYLFSHLLHFCTQIMRGVAFHSQSVGSRNL